MLASLRILLLCVAAAVGYGIVHDQVTARVCVEYFTIGHPPVFDTDDPTLLAFGWGVLATWWVGLLLGVPLAIAARAGFWPKRSARSLIRPILTLLLVMAIGAIIAGFAGWSLAKNRTIHLIGTLGARVPADRHAAFLADAWAHSASYALGFLGGIVVVVRVVWVRLRQ